MTLEEINQIKKDADRAIHSARRCKDRAERIAAARKHDGQPPEKFKTVSDILYHTMYAYSDDQKLIQDALRKYLPDICRELELQLEAEARTHSNKAKMLNAQVSAFFNNNENEKEPTL